MSSTGIDMDAVRKKLKQLEKSDNRSTFTWKPQPDTKTKVRLVPYRHSSEMPFIELYFHYGINGKTYVSPISYGNPDPFVEFSNKLKETGDREDWKMSRKFDPKMRTYAPIVVRSEMEKGVRFWGFGKTVYQELLTYITDPDWGDISDPMTGRDFVINYESPSTPGGFPSTTITPKPNSLPLTEDKALLKRLLEDQPRIEEIFPEPTYEELEEAMRKWISGEDDSEDESATDELDDDNDESETIGKMPKTSMDDLNDTFSDIFDEDDG